MVKVINEIEKILHNVHGVPMQLNSVGDKILVTIQMSNGRSQTVMIDTRAMPSNMGTIVRLRSRACIARNFRYVRTALATNASMKLGGLALDTSASPPAIDVTYNLDADQLNVAEFLHALSQVAFYADVIEARNLGSDEF